MTEEEKEQSCSSKVFKHGSWSTDDVEKLIHYWNTLNKTGVEIGLLLDRSPGSVVTKVRRLRRHGVKMKKRSLYKSHKEEKEEEARKCLKCQEDFLSDNLFNRICPRCTRINAGVYDKSIMDFVR